MDELPLNVNIMNYFCRAPHIVYRREAFGGLLFNPNTATTLEVDRSAFRLFELLDGTQTLSHLRTKIEEEFQVKISPTDLQKVTQQFLAAGFIISCAKKRTPISLDKTAIGSKETWCPDQHLSGPDTVHLMVTHNCNFSCPGCFAHAFGKEGNTELDTHEIFYLIDQLAEMKVFQLAIGGGEPFLRDDLLDIIKYSHSAGILPNVTTNGSFLTKTTALELQPYLGKMQFSLMAPNQTQNDRLRSLGSWKDFLTASRLANQCDIRYGVNLLVNSKTLPVLLNLVRFIVTHGATTVNILRPKPASNQNIWFKHHHLQQHHLVKLHKQLLHLQELFPQLNITIDCALTNLMHHLPVQFRLQHGIFGCTAGRRFVSINASGAVYPCCFLVDQSFLLGNVTTERFKDIWQRVVSQKDRFKLKKPTQSGVKYPENCLSIIRNEE